MNKELIDRAWACLPREFKEEVKKKYARCVEIDADDNPNLPAYAVKSAISRRALLEKLFGVHNLTSDAEGEEMLTVKRSDVINEFDKLHKLSYKAADLQLGLNAFRTLFGSKCLPDDNEDNFVSKEPKYRVNDKVICGVLADRKECIIVHYNINTKEYRLRVIEDGTTIHRSEEFIYGFAPNEPKPAEPKNEGTRQKQYVPKNAESGTHLDSIANNDFRDHNRLHIAAMAMQGLISKTPRFSSYEISNLVRISLDCADALIKKAEGGSDE